MLPPRSLTLRALLPAPLLLNCNISAHLTRDSEARLHTSQLHSLPITQLKNHSPTTWSSIQIFAARRASSKTRQQNEIFVSFIWTRNTYLIAGCSLNVYSVDASESSASRAWTFSMQRALFLRNAMISRGEGLVYQLRCPKSFHFLLTVNNALPSLRLSPWWTRFACLSYLELQAYIRQGLLLRQAAPSLFLSFALDEKRGRRLGRVRSAAHVSVEWGTANLAVPQRYSTIDRRELL